MKPRKEFHNINGATRGYWVYDMPPVENRGHFDYWGSVIGVPCPVCGQGNTTETSALEPLGALFAIIAAPPS